MEVCTFRNVCTSIVRKGTVKICIKVSTKYTLSILSRRTRLLFCSGCVDSVPNDGWPILSPVPRACLYWNSANTLGVSCHPPRERWSKSAVFPLQHEPAVCVRIVSHRHTATRKNVPGTKSVPAAALSHVPCVHRVCPYMTINSLYVDVSYMNSQRFIRSVQCISIASASSTLASCATGRTLI